MSFTYYATFSGKKFDVSNISENDICLQDISHHLTKICRYGGAMQLHEHYSVAQHSILLCQYVLERYGYDHLALAKYLLMHDASEAYLGDVVSGLKQYLPDYKDLEKTIQSKIERKYGIKSDDVSMCEAAKILDTRILLDEAARFAPQHYQLFVDNCPEGIKPLKIDIEHDPDLHCIRSQFLRMCAALNIKD